MPGAITLLHHDPSSAIAALYNKLTGLPAAGNVLGWCVVTIFPTTSELCDALVLILSFPTRRPRRLRRGVNVSLHLDDGSLGQPACHVSEPMRLVLYPCSRHEQHPHDGRFTLVGGDLQRCRSIVCGR